MNIDKYYVTINEKMETVNKEFPMHYYRFIDANVNYGLFKNTPKRDNKFKKLCKIIAVFIALKLLEIWSIISIPIIIVYIYLALSDWDLAAIPPFIFFLDILSYIMLGICGLFFGMIGCVCIVDWIKSNWKWAKSIVEKYEN